MVIWKSRCAETCAASPLENVEPAWARGVPPMPIITRIHTPIFTGHSQEQPHRWAAWSGVNFYLVTPVKFCDMRIQPKCKTLERFTKKGRLSPAPNPRSGCFLTAYGIEAV